MNLKKIIEVEATVRRFPSDVPCCHENTMKGEVFDQKLLDFSYRQIH
jgi:hypothetical protein